MSTLKLPPSWKTWLALSLVAATLPFLWNTCGQDQSWGGDYAGYLTQAREIVRGHRQLQPFYIYNPGVQYLAPPAYPPGLSLVQAPFFRSELPDISFFIRFTTLIWWLCGLVLFWFWKNTAPVWAAAGAAVFFLFHPLFLQFKNSILPDLLFTLLIWMAIYIYVYRKDNAVKMAVGCGLLAGMAWLTRANGVVLLLALALHQLPELLAYFRRPKQGKDRLANLRFAGTAIGSALLLYGAVQILLFPAPATGSYFDQIQLMGPSFWANTTRNAEECVRSILTLFQLGLPTAEIHGHDKADLAAELGGIVAFGLAVAGMFLPGNKREGLVGLFLAGTLLLLLLWPLVQGTRYLLPVFPGLIFYLLRGLNSIKPANQFGKIALWALLPLLFYGEYGRAYSVLKEKAGQRDPGAPEHLTNQETYQYIRKNTPDTAIIAYHHPLILGLYAERKSIRWRINEPEDLQEELRDFRVDYLLVNNWVSDSDPALERYLEFYQPSLDTVWFNERNCLYRISR